MHRLLYKTVILNLLLAATHAYAFDPELESCIRRNEPQTTAIQRIEMRSIDRVGYEKLLTADIYLKRFAADSSALIAYFRDPDDIIGTRLLVREQQPDNEMYMYMPSLFKIRRITSKRISSSMYGSDFSYEDLQRLYGMLSAERPQQAADAELDGRPVHVLVSEPASDSGSKYESVSAWFDKDICLLRKMEFYESGGRLRKELLIDSNSVKKIGDIHVAHKMQMTDLRNDTQTRLSISNVQLDVPIPDEVFQHERLRDFRGIQ